MASCRYEIENNLITRLTLHTWDKDLVENQKVNKNFKPLFLGKQNSLFPCVSKFIVDGEKT